MDNRAGSSVKNLMTYRASVNAALTIHNMTGSPHRKAQRAQISAHNYEKYLRLMSQMAELELELRKPRVIKSTLMTLPAELRLEIFKHLIYPGDVYIRFRAKAANHDARFSHILDEWDVETPRPRPIQYTPVTTPRRKLLKWKEEPPQAPASAQTQLFLISKQLRDEAMHFYLTKNTFYMMGSDCALPYLS